MNKLDFLVDTRDKRNALLIIFMTLLFILISGLHFYLGWVLLQAQTYTEIFDLLNRWSVQTAFLGRAVLIGMSMVPFKLFPFVYRLLSTMAAFEGVTLVLSLLILLTRPGTRKEIRLKRTVLLNCLIYAILIVLLALTAMLSFQAGSLLTVLKYLHGFAYVCIGFNGLLLLYNGYWLCHIALIDYPDALQVHVEIVE